MAFLQLSVKNGAIVDSNNKPVRLRGFNTAGIEYGDGVGGYSQAFINRMAATFPGMNLWRLAINSEWWNSNVALSNGFHYQAWIQQLITWMKATGCYVEVDTVTFVTLLPQTSGSFCSHLIGNPPYVQVGADTFTRANQSGWGTASDGETYTVLQGTPTLSMSGNEGVLTAPNGTENKIQLGSTTSYGNMDLLVRCSQTSPIGNDDASLYYFTDVNNWYRATMWPNQLQIAKKVGGVFTQLGLVTPNPAITASPDFWWLRFRIQNGTLEAGVWKDGSVEPDSWTASVTDTDLSTGGYGLGGALSGSDSVQFDSFTVTIPSTTCIVSQDTRNNPPWTEAQAISSFTSFWNSFIPLYINDNAILYDALNEPSNGGVFTGDEYNALNTMMNVIQGLQPNALIFVNSPSVMDAIIAGTKSDFSQPNLIWTFHTYDDIPGNSRWWSKIQNNRTNRWPYAKAHNHGLAIEEWNVGQQDASMNDFAQTVAGLGRQGFAVIYYQAGDMLHGNGSITSQGRLVQRAFRDIVYKHIGIAKQSRVGR